MLKILTWDTELIIFFFIDDFSSKLYFKNPDKSDLGTYSISVSDTDGVSSSFVMDEEGKVFIISSISSLYCLKCTKNCPRRKEKNATTLTLFRMHLEKTKKNTLQASCGYLFF